MQEEEDKTRGEKEGGKVLHEPRTRVNSAECTRSFPYMPAAHTALPSYVPNTLLRRLHSPAPSASET